MSSPLPPLPTFLILGAQKSATRWLRTNLGEHPDVFAASLELSYFNQKYRLGPDFYRSQFEGWNGEPIVGEATPGYMMYRHRPARVAKRIQETIPDVRLIVLLRNPIDRANSALVHHVKRERLSKRAKLTTLVQEKAPEEDRLGLITGGLYAASLIPFVERFGDQLIFFLHDDVTDDPLWVYRTALEHIGASPDFVPPALDEVVFSNQTKPSVKRRSSLSDEDRKLLWGYFADDVAILGPMIDRDLSSWNPNLPEDLWPELPGDLASYADAVTGWVQTLVDGVDPGQYDLPTPCADYNVGDLLYHLIASVDFTVRLNGAEGGDADAFAAPAILADPSGAFAAVRATLRALLDDPTTMKKTAGQIAIDVGTGPQVVGLPTRISLGCQLVNVLAHGWDLAVATGQAADMPDELTSASLTFLQSMLERTPLMRVVYGEELPIDASASATERFLAFIGRDPAWARPVEVH
jgi:uncharacterized protein (TIGR03086 family)